LQLIQSQQDLAVTGVLFAQRSLIEQEDLLAEIIGTRVEYLAPLDNGFQFNLPSPSNLEDWIELGLEANFELNASLLENQIAYHNYQAVRSTRLPTLNFSASMSSSATDILRYNQLIDDAPCLAYGGNPACPAEYTESESELDDVRLSLNFSLPLFSGGLLSSQIRQASFQYEATNYAITRQQRQLERAIRSSFLGVELGISQIRAYEQAILSAQTALQASERAFSLGAATTSDILFAEENLLNAQVNLSNAKKDFILNSFNLKALIGNLTAEDISLLSESLN
jgi:outer membrane protein